MKLGVMIEGQEGIGWQEWRDIVRWTEDLGYESLWRSDHFFSLGRGPRQRDSLETFVSLTYAAEHTSRIRFGPLVCSMTFRHPAVLARMAAAVDQLSNGRFVLGIGAGWNQAEHEAFGIPLPPPGPRLRALDEGAVVIKRLLSEATVSFSGRHFELREASVNPKPAQQALPILIGGGGEQLTLRVVARHADEWNMPARSIEEYRRKVAALREHCEREGRDPASIAHSLMCQYAIGETEDEARSRLSERARAATAGKHGLDRLPWVFGSPSQFVEMLQALEAEGVSRVMLQNLDPPAYETLAAVAQEVLPKV